MKKALFLVIFLAVVAVPLSSQVLSPDAAKKELENRGIEEDEVKKRMLEKGIDIDNIDPTNASEVLRAEQALESVIQEIEAEASENTEEALGESTTEPTETIVDAVEEDRGIEEAIAEELIDTQAETDLPESRIYGQKIFRDKTIKVFSNAENVRPSASYILGPGDQVNISIWGLSQEEATYTVNLEGFIKPSQMPRISLKGKTFQQVKDILRSRYAQYYNFRREEFEVTITYARTITVNILGEVFNPGSFTLPATNTAFNALVAAGGPTDIGSVRNIRLIRAGETTRQIDVYEFMNDPSVQEQFYLQDNDIIHVSTIGRTASISGAVRRPFIFELAPGEQLKQLVKYAGGLENNAYQSNIQVKRFVDDVEKIIDVNFRQLQQSTGDFNLESGDAVVIQKIPQPYDNYVEITGAIELEGQYELVNGMKISDLVKKGILLEGARTDIAFLLRTRPDGTTGYERIDLADAVQNPGTPTDLALQSRDRLRVLSQTVFVDQAVISITGSVRSPGEQELDKDQDLKLDEAIILAGGLRPDATDFAYVYRANPANRNQMEYIRVNIRAAIANPNSAENIALQPQDRINILSQFSFSDQSIVSIGGAVRNPGEYKYDQSLRLSDVITLAGGLKLEASSSRIDISRVIFNANEATQTVVATVEIDDNYNILDGSIFELQPYDQINVRYVPEFELQKNIVIRGEVSYPGRYALIDKNEKLWSVIKRAGGLTPEAFPAGATLYRVDDNTGYVILKLDEVAQDPSSRHNFILKKDDIIEIPKQKDLVTILLNATQAAELYPDKFLSEGKLNVAFSDGKNARWYIEKYAAGVGEKGRRRLISVEHANGKIEQTEGFLVKRYPRVEKGSIIRVGVKREDPEKTREPKEDIDWGNVLADSITQATAILTLILLIQRLD